MTQWHHKIACEGGQTVRVLRLPGDPRIALAASDTPVVLDREAAIALMAALADLAHAATAWGAR